ncbi:S-layer homology domain-containing protein [Candidatus Saganbacteria bacterium]|nr:S-layer homology domain-containing protein [Candidatus Saganbacteria bacterium]
MRRASLAFVFFLCLCAPALAISANLGEIGVGARPLSMGKAYLGVADDASAIFLNPAGLAMEPSLKVVSMTGKLLEDITYISLGTSGQTRYGVFGFGYINAGTGGIPLTTLTETPTQTVVSQYDVTDYSSSIMYFTYARELMPDLTAGASIKYFSQGFSKDSGAMSGSNGSGTDLDLATLWRPHPWIKTGVMLENILPASFFGLFKWKSGAEEGIAAQAKTGVSFKMIGKDGWRQYGEQVVNADLDLDMAVTQKRPGLWHAGLEWWFNPIVAIRAGIDQKAKATEAGIGVDSNWTTGLGLKYRGYSFDFAYHQYGDLAENTTYFFSLGYVGEEKPALPVLKIKEAKEEGLTLKSREGLKTFSDVIPGFWAKDAIEYLATLNIMTGYPDRTFRPEAAVTRAELCAILVKAKEFPAQPLTTDVFPDVPLTHWAAPYIKIAVDRRYVSGYPDGKFLPWQKMTRAEAVVVISKFAGLTEPLSLSDNPFPDVPKRHWAARAIHVAKTAGLLEYLSGKNFEPDAVLTRAEAAEILSKTVFVKEKIREQIFKKKSSFVPRQTRDFGG